MEKRMTGSRMTADDARGGAEGATAELGDAQLDRIAGGALRFEGGAGFDFVQVNGSN